jgi:hypothetical protein
MLYSSPKAKSSLAYAVSDFASRGIQYLNLRCLVLSRRRAARLRVCLVVPVKFFLKNFSFVFGN